MRGNDQRRVCLFRMFDQRADQGLTGRLIKLAGWLVGEKQARLGHHGAGDGDTLRLPA